jgi:hypothetical protein
MSLLGEKRIFYISTGNELSGNVNSFTRSLDIPDDFNRAVIGQASIPISYYVVVEGYNTFQLKEPNFSAVTITVPEGNYNVNSFTLAVKALLNTNSPNLYTYNITYPINYTENNTGKITITNTSYTGSGNSIIVGDGLYEQFGFNRGSTNTFSSGALTATNVWNFTPETSIFLHCNLVKDGVSDVLGFFPFGNNVVLGNMNWVNPSLYENSKYIVPSQTVVFSFTDENGFPLFFNGVSTTFSLIVFKESRIFEKISRFLDWFVLKDEKEEETLGNYKQAELDNSEIYHPETELNTLPPPTLTRQNAYSEYQPEEEVENQEEIENVENPDEVVDELFEDQEPIQIDENKTIEPEEQVDVVDELFKDQEPIKVNEVPDVPLNDEKLDKLLK